MFKRLVSAALIFGAAAIAPPVSAQTTPLSCGDHAQMSERLSSRFKETRLGAGLQNPETVMELWSSEETGSWTVLVIRPNGTACVVATGNHWFNTIPVKEGIPS